MLCFPFSDGVAFQNQLLKNMYVSDSLKKKRKTFVRQRARILQRGKREERFPPPSTGSCPKCPQPGVGQAKAVSQELHPVLGHPCCLPKCVIRELRLRVTLMWGTGFLSNGLALCATVPAWFLVHTALLYPLWHVMPIQISPESSQGAEVASNFSERLFSQVSKTLPKQLGNWFLLISYLLPKEQWLQLSKHEVVMILK